MSRRPLARHAAIPQDFCENIPTRKPRDGEPSRTVPLYIAIQLAEEYYCQYARHQVNAAYCRERYKKRRAAKRAEGNHEE